jgi:glutathione synthase/RimK-type ligase-like ATP-grasp enzyme
MKYDVVILTDSRYENPTHTDWYIDQVLLEDKLVQEALEAKGLKVIRKDWACEKFDWSKASYALFRTTWDYFDRYTDFFRWFEKTQKLLTFINSPEIIYWNLDKHYLKELNSKGVNIPNTLFIEPGENITLEQLFNSKNWDKAIIKPAIGGAARETYLIDSNSLDEYESTFQSLISNEAMLFQEFQKNIQFSGEISLIMIGGKYTHAVLKKAKADDFRVQDDFGGSVEVYTPSQNEIDFAEKALTACPNQPLYARVDLFYDNTDQLSLGELELIEPELWFRNYPKAADELAVVIMEFILSNND